MKSKLYHIQLPSSIELFPDNTQNPTYCRHFLDFLEILYRELEIFLTSVGNVDTIHSLPSMSVLARICGGNNTRWNGLRMRSHTGMSLSWCSRRLSTENNQTSEIKPDTTSTGFVMRYPVAEKPANRISARRYEQEQQRLGNRLKERWYCRVLHIFLIISSLGRDFVEIHLWRLSISRYDVLMESIESL